MAPVDILSDMARALNPAEWHVWWADPILVPDHFHELLEPGERLRYAQYHHAADRRRFLAGRVLLRQVAAGYLATACAFRCQMSSYRHREPPRG
jgi:hypothetical protein